MKLINKAKLPFILLVFFSVLSEAGTIKGNFKNTGKAEYIYFYQYLGNIVFKSDSAKLSNGAINYAVKIPTGLYRLGISEEQSFNLIINSTESIEVEADFANLDKTISIKGSKENEQYGKFNSVNIKYNEAFNQLDKAAQPIVAARSQDPQKFNTEIKKLQIKLDSLNKNRAEQLSKFNTENKNLFVSTLTSPFLAEESISKENFFSKEELSNPDFARSDAVSNRIIMYLQKFSGQQIAQLQEEASTLLGLPEPGSLNKEAFYITLIKIFQPYDPEYAKALASMYQKEYPKSKAVVKVISELPKGQPQVGDNAPDIKLLNPEGKTVALSSLKGKVVLIDFWASWCGPCRMENPNVVRAYQKYKEKGFTIYSVSLDESKDKWMGAIQKDGLVWESHVSDLKGWQSSAAQLYQVKGIPATFLVGKDGKVVAKNLRGSSLEEKLAELCK